MREGALNHFLFRFEAPVFVHGHHMGFPDASQLVLEVLKAVRFGSSLLLSSGDVFVEVIQSFHDFFIGACNNKQSVEKTNLRAVRQT